MIINRTAKRGKKKKRNALCCKVKKKVGIAKGNKHSVCSKVLPARESRYIEERRN